MFNFGWRLFAFEVNHPRLLDIVNEKIMLLPTTPIKA